MMNNAANAAKLHNVAFGDDNDCNGAFIAPFNLLLCNDDDIVSP